MKLAEYIEALSYDVAFWMAGIRDPRYPLAQLGDLSLEVSQKLRSMAIIVLLTEGDTDTFYHNLIRSGRTREAYLSRCLNERRIYDHHRASGRYGPLMDAVAAGEFSLARRIAQLSPEDWMKGHEYEDDFFFAQLVHALIRETPDRRRAEKLLDGFESYLEGKPDARLEAAKAVAWRDQEKFDEAFESLLDAREDDIKADLQRAQLAEPPAIAQRQVYIEGLGVIRLAEAAGLTCQKEYRYCPSLARLPMQKPFPGE
jgi:hypothetical protein